MEDSDSDFRAHEEAKPTEASSEVLMLPKLNREILPRPRNHRNFQSHNHDNTNSEPSTMSMYGEVQATPMSYNIIHRKADKMRA